VENILDNFGWFIRLKKMATEKVLLLDKGSGRQMGSIEFRDFPMSVKLTTSYPRDGSLTDSVLSSLHKEEVKRQRGNPRLKRDGLTAEQEAMVKTSKRVAFAVFGAATVELRGMHF